MKWIAMVGLSGFLGLAATGCVKSSVHEAAMAEWASRVEALEGQLSACEGTLSETRGQLADTRNLLSETESLLNGNRDQLATCRRQLADALATADQTDAERQALAARLEELAAIERELRERDRIFQDIAAAFDELIRNGFVEVAIERGRLVIKMPQDILFESGRAEIGAEGREALRQVGQVLAALTERKFQVEGHTDNVPINTRTFPSNWELSAARALAVVHLFQEVGVGGANVSAGGFGEFQPRAENDTAENKALNRRIEIVMVPDMEAIFGGIAPR